MQNITVEALMQQIRQKWHYKECYRQANLKRMKNLRILAKSNAEMALAFINRKNKNLAERCLKFIIYLSAGFLFTMQIQLIYTANYLSLLNCSLFYVR